MHVAILGPGGVGGFLAAALARAGEAVSVIAREETATRLDAHGLSVRSVVLGDFSVPVRVRGRLEEPVDVLLVATKAAGLSDALARIDATPGLVVPQLNGLDHMGVLRDRFGSERVAAGVIRIESDRPSPGEIVQTSPAARVTVASDRDELGAPLEALVATLRGAGLAADRGPSEAAVLWGKLVRLNALALTTSASDRPLGEIRADPRWRSALESAVRETAAVARADGAAIDPADTLAELEAAHAGLGSSMRRDIAAGRPTELDAIAGAVLRAARRHGVSCPAVTWLAARVARRAGEVLTLPPEA
jgi:2-dehydropantoate 2-reductase